MGDFGTRSESYRKAVPNAAHVPPPPAATTSPLSRATFLSKATYAWMTPLVELGCERGLAPADLPPHSVEMTPASILARFNVHWEREKESRGRQASLTRTFLRCHSHDIFAIVLLLTASAAAWVLSPSVWIRNLVRFSRDDTAETSDGVSKKRFV